ncbi:MAG: hypothetical protein MJZ85_02700 [Bacteroidales bacterium]|nr:hypothetical protein [Bacteroidales bacterium]
MRQAETDRFERNRELYEIYKANPDYYDVAFDEASGGMKATHKKHCFDPDKGDYEKMVQNVGFNMGNSVVLTSEYGKAVGENFFDGFWNGMSFEIGSSLGVGKNNIKAILNHCRKKSAEIAIIFFPKKELYSKCRVYDGISKFNGQTNYRFLSIICVVENSLFTYK